MLLRFATLLLALNAFTIGCCGPHVYRGSCCGPCGGGGVGPVANCIGCKKGCGEVYWGDWISDPPDCCDPCDDCGNFIGQQGGRRGVFGCYPLCWPGLFPLHSSRYGDSCGGCASCGDGSEGEVYEEGEVIHSAAPQIHAAPQAAPMPHPAPPPRTAMRSVRPPAVRTAKPRVVQPVVYEEVEETLVEEEPASDPPTAQRSRRNYAR